MNPRKMQGMMKKMGISQEEVPAEQVIIKTKDKELIINNPSVSKVKMMGQTTFQVAGSAEEREISSTPEISDDDIKTVMEQAEVDRETALKAIQDHKGDLAESILSLSKS